MSDIVRRALRAHPLLTAELWQRGMFTPEEKTEMLQRRSEYRQKSPLGPARLATLLAQGDTQLAARAVSRSLLDSDELVWLDRLLRFRKRNGKRDELCRIVERALEGRKANVRNAR